MTAPDFLLQEMTGESHNLEDFLSDRIVVVVFWATWSQRSLNELQDIENLQAEWPAGGVTILAVNVNSQSLSASSKDSIRIQVEALQSSHRYFWDDGLGVFQQYGVIAVPSTVILDKNGTIRTLINGYSGTGRTILEDSLKAMLGLLSGEISQLDTSGYQPVKKAQLHFALGQKLLQQKKYDHALEQYREAILLDTAFVLPLLSSGLIYEKTGQEKKAREYYLKVQEKDPDSALAQWKLGCIASCSGDTAAAMRYLNRALELDENLSGARLDRAQLELSRGNIATAQSDLDFAAEIDPWNLRLKAVQASYAAQQGDIEEAVLILRSAVEKILRER